MYGLLLDSIQKFIREKYGEHYWVAVRRKAKLSNHWFVTHEVYNDSVMTDLIDSAAAVLGEDRDNVMKMFGEYFVKNIGRYGYARLLRVLGRDMRDFLNGLDNLHEYLRFSYTKMLPPVFSCEKETPRGMLLHYLTTRQGYLPYVIGQLLAVGRIYSKVITIKILSEQNGPDGLHVVLDLQFDNYELLKHKIENPLANSLKVDGMAFLSIFPFCVVFDEEMVITMVGEKLSRVLPNIVGKVMEDAFSIRRPRTINLDWQSINMHTNCVFELQSTDCVEHRHYETEGKYSPHIEVEGPLPKLRLKGEMLPLKQNEYVIYMCSPVMESPEEMYQANVYIGDLALHDSNREYILAGTQQHPELSLALNQEQIRSKQLEDSINQTDQLLYQMIPKPIADQLRSGETPLNTCQVLPSVSILFADIVSFTPMCKRLRPMEVVCLLNALFVAFDNLCEKHHVYKVQTIGDGYMAVCGAPIQTEHHAEYMTDFGCSAIDVASKINDPSTNQTIKIRVGIHSGTVVAGVVGSNILRYDVYGDTVNVAARMEATGEPMKVHVSQHTADLLQDSRYIVEERGEAQIKGIGMMKTYWVRGKKEDEQDDKEQLNPLQRSQKIRKASAGRRNTLLGTNVFTPSKNFLSTHRSYSLQPMDSTIHLFNHRSRSPPTSMRAGSLSPAPSEWPKLDIAIRAANTSTESLLECDESDIKLEELQALMPAQSHDSNDLSMMAATSAKPSDLQYYAKIAEENAQKARALADWMAMLANAGQQQSSASSTPVEPEEDQEVRQYCTIL